MRAAHDLPIFHNTVAQDLVAFPQYSGITDQVDSVGNATITPASYANQRLAHGLAFT